MASLVQHQFKKVCNMSTAIIMQNIYILCLVSMPFPFVLWVNGPLSHFKHFVSIVDVSKWPILMMVPCIYFFLYMSMTSRDFHHLSIGISRPICLIVRFMFAVSILPNQPRKAVAYLSIFVWFVLCLDSTLACHGWF